jgi:glycosyltransferase involved in cell wall biosynthesis
MASGCPVITYGNSSLKEVVGDDGIVIEEGLSFTKTMKDAIDTPEKFIRRALKAKKRARSFTWSRTAKDIIEELRVYDPNRVNATRSDEIKG